MPDFLIYLILPIAIIGFIAYRGHRFERDGSWNPTPLGKMRRFHNGAWQYRDQTSDEQNHERDFKGNW